MQAEFDRTQSETFVEVARDRQILTEEQAAMLLEQSMERSVMAAALSIELGLLQPVDVEVVEAFIAPNDLAPGYQLRSVLGHGALGVVFRAHQPHLKRDVAIKAIKQSSLSQQGAIARFQQEGAAIGRLHHPNIVSAFDSGTHGNRLYLVMELVAGVDLRKRLTEGPLDVRKALSIVRQTAAGLSHALSHQIIHRDIKPGNLFLTEAPAGFELPKGVPLVKIGDFGLAKLNPLNEAAGDDTHLTMTGAALGTPMYSAPEQLTGDEVDHRADIYALGATLFHALSGQTPFQADAVSKLVVAKVTGQRPRLELLPDDLHPGVMQLILQMMEHDPEDRLGDYETVIARVDELLQAITTGTEADTQETMPLIPAAAKKADRPKGRRRHRRIGLLALIVAVFVCLPAIYFWYVLQEPAQPSMVPSGWEAPLFDGNTLDDWSDRSGLWKTDMDAEGGRILVGKGAAVRNLPSRPGQAVPGFGVRIGIDLQQTPSVEVHFGFEGEPIDQARRLVAQVSTSGVSLGTRDGVGGDYSRISSPIELPKLAADASLYHELRIELHGDRWFLFLDGERFGDAKADRQADNGKIQLVASEGTVHFDGPSMFGLQPQPPAQP